MMNRRMPGQRRQDNSLPWQGRNSFDSLLTLAYKSAHLMPPGESLALTVDEVIKLKQAGVADSTIELLIKRSGDARSAGVWRQDGWIVHSTPIREPQANTEASQAAYPLFVQPRVSAGRR